MRPAFAGYGLCLGLALSGLRAGADSSKGASTNALVALEWADTASGAFRDVRESAGRGHFRARTGRGWPSGWVPVFVVPHDTGNELRRTPPRGLEADATPVFFALPASDESGSAEISGRWEVRAERSDGSRLRFSLELAAHRGSLLGRFDPDTDYRFARLTGGTWNTGSMTGRVEYIQDRFELRARRFGNRLSGRWRNEEGSEDAGWTAERPDPEPAMPPGTVVDLLGWTGPNGTRTWKLRSTPPGPGWSPDTEALCRVWTVD